MGLSAVVITYNEEERIEACLRSLSFADEIVVLDSFSTDSTRDIAKRFTDKVSCREFTGFADQWNAAIEMATLEWVLLIGADEVVSEGLEADIKAALAEGKYNAYRMPRLSVFLGREIHHCGWYPDYQIRLVKRKLAHVPNRLVRETMEVDCECGKLKNDLYHYSFEHMDEFCRKMLRYARADAQEKFDVGRRFNLFDMLNPPFTFFSMFVLKGGFMDGLHGLVLSMLAGGSSAIRYAMLWDLGICEAKDKKSSE